jgi:WD40 repeat protein
VAFGPDQETIVTGDAEGVVRVGALSGEEPHLLLAHDERIKAVTISPDGRWVFSSVGSETRRWPMPDLSQQPLHVASLETLLDDLRSRTNLTVVEDSDSPNGWTVEVGPFALRP